MVEAVFTLLHTPLWRAKR